MILIPESDLSTVGSLECYDNYEFFARAPGGGTWPPGVAYARRVPPRENDRAHTRHTHVVRHVCAYSRERREQQGKSAPLRDLLVFILDFGLRLMYLEASIRFRSCVFISVWLKNYFISRFIRFSTFMFLYILSLQSYIFHTTITKSLA